MHTSKKVLMVIPHMVGGGAERVSSQIINNMNSKGYDTTYMLTSSKKHEVIRTDLDDNTPLVLLTEELKAETTIEKLCYLPQKYLSVFFGKMYEKADKFSPAWVGKMTIMWQYHREILYIRSLLKANPTMSVIAFSQPAMPIVALAAQNLPNTVILSERADPNMLMKKRYGKKFIAKYYARADRMVFQTYDAKAVYPKNVGDKGVVISNPIKAGLPQPYFGERNKTITTFCRISRQKNLSVMVEAFSKIYAEFPEYTLRIIGDAPNSDDKKELANVKALIDKLHLNDAVKFEPFMSNVHEAIIKDAMYVSSSDYEGISNAMLEAMAIGMPTVCTDCPIGGAKATIKDGENGLLVPIKDPQALYDAIKRVIVEDGLSKRLSENAAKLREELSLSKTTDKWIALLGEE